MSSLGNFWRKCKCFGFFLILMPIKMPLPHLWLVCVLICFSSSNTKSAITGVWQLIISATYRHHAKQSHLWFCRFTPDAATNIGTKNTSWICVCTCMCVPKQCMALLSNQFLGVCVHFLAVMQQIHQKQFCFALAKIPCHHFNIKLLTNETNMIVSLGVLLMYDVLRH